MAQFYIHRSNRIERLTRAIAEQLRAPRGGPFNSERIIVQGRGMGVWLSHELAERLGVWAGQMPYPRHFIEEIAQKVLGPSAFGDPPLSQDTMEWAVQALLDEALPEPAFAALRHYVKGDRDGLRRAQLCARIAQAFDQYLVFRPQLVRKWEDEHTAVIESDAQAWQPILWRRVVERLGAQHIARVEQRLHDRLRNGEPIVGLPPRVSVFGVSTLPPLYVRLLVALSYHVDVHFFLFSPSPQAWLNERNTSDGRRRVDVENRLVASMGFLGADFNAVLTEALEEQGITPQQEALYEEPQQDTVLGRLQRNIYHLRQPDPDKPDPDGHHSNESTAQEELPSIRVHSCHGPTREVEVLRDQILALTSRADDPLKPEEIVVLCPDIETYAPLIDAGFSRHKRESDHLPFHISDRSSRRESPLIEALDRILGMVRGRVTATEVIDLLKVESIQLRFQLSMSDVEQIEGWIAESGLHWGMDAAHRGSQNVPAVEDFTWCFGLKRLMLGYAMLTGDEPQLVGGVVPYEGIEGQNAHTLGKLAHFVRSLFRWLRQLGSRRTLSEWNAVLLELASELFTDDTSTGYQIGQLRRAMTSVAGAAGNARFTGELDVAVIRDLLERNVDLLAPERGFLAGGIMFCALIPMRSIPYRVVCLLGMNDGAFPRSPRPLEIDLMAAGTRRAGDRSPREDDRYLFLETLSAARERVIATYTGRALKDNKKLPPSVCVAELLDSVGNSVLVEHRLQGFNPAYFQEGDSELFSYSEEYAGAASALLNERQNRAALADGSTPIVESSDIQLDDLIRFYRSPQAFFLSRRLGIDLNEYGTALSDREPLEMQGLSDWAVGDRLLHGRLANRSTSQTEALLRATGTLPLGQQGHLVVAKQDAIAAAIAERTIICRAGNPLAPYRIALQLSDGRKLLGAIDNRWQGGFVEHSFSKLKTKRYLSSWIRHVAACASGAEHTTTVISRGDYKACEERAWPALDDAAARVILSQLVQFYREGLTAALPFLPATSGAYHKSLLNPRSLNHPAVALAAAIDCYTADRCDDTEYDPHPRRAFGDALPPFEPCDADNPEAVRQSRFHRIAVAVFQPLRENERRS